MVQDVSGLVLAFAWELRFLRNMQVNAACVSPRLPVSLPDCIHVKKTHQRSTVRYPLK